MDDIIYDPAIFKAPDAIPLERDQLAIFLAGSIEMGAARNWQDALIETIYAKGLPFLIFNPRRDDWDASWEQSIENPQFKEQVQWELQALESADIILMHFEPNTKSPITLLELGLFAQSGKLWVHCPGGFWRKGNVDIVCERYGIKQVGSLPSFIGVLTALVGGE